MENKAELLESLMSQVMKNFYNEMSEEEKKAHDKAMEKIEKSRKFVWIEIK